MYIVGEEDEVSIRDVAHMVAEAMEFEGELIVSQLCICHVAYVLVFTC